MEIQTNKKCQPLIQAIIEQCNPSLQLSFFEFLQTEIILEMAIIGKNYKLSYDFYKLAMFVAYSRKYLNRVDRSMYYIFYEEKQFEALQKAFIIDIAKSKDQQFFQLANQYESQLSYLEKETQFIQDREEFNELIESVFFQTDYPLPACKRQTIGVYCETPYQEFMSLIRFPLIQGKDDFSEPPLQELQKYFIQGKDIEKTIQIINQNGAQNLHKITYLRFCPWQFISNKSLNECNFIEGFQLHNFICILFKMIQTNAKSSKIVIQHQKDPIMKIAEFVTRANIFKNIVLAVQEKLCFLFQSYGDIYQVISKGQHCVALPKFQFWNGAMTIWVRQCQQLQTQLFKAYSYVLAKQRQENLSRFLDKKSQNFPSLYNSLKDDLHENSFFQKKKDDLYKEMGESYEQFFGENQDSFQILAKDFMEHQIDISINEITVHKIGHSNHVIKRTPIMRQFLDNLVQESNKFYTYLKQIVHKKTDKKMSLSILKDLIKEDLDFLDRKFTRPVLLKEILLSAQEIISDLIQKMPEYVIFKEEGMEKYNLHFDFSHKDNLLDYFAVKSEMPNDCKVQLRSFYDIQKTISCQQMIHLAMSTKADSSLIQSQIEEEFYDSSVSNSSMMSGDEE